MNKNIVGILLAAGRSSRFGSHKLLHTLADTQKAVAVQAAENLLKILPNSIAIVRKDDEKLKTLLAKTGIKLVENPNAELGLSSSIQCGVQHSSEADGWIISLADMPFIPAIVIKQVTCTIQQGALIAAPEYDNQRGHPVGFSNQLVDELLDLQGDIGAKAIIQKYLSDLQIIKTTSHAILRDIDFPADLSQESG